MLAVMRTTVFVILLVLTACGAAPRGAHEPASVFSTHADARMQVDEVLAEAGRRGVNALLVFGTDRCHDSRGLAGQITADGALSGLVQDHYALAFVEVGQRDTNLDQLARFGVEWIFGTPTVLVVTPDGELLSGETVHDWRMADSAARADLEAYLARYSAASPPARTAHANIDAIVSGWLPLNERLAEIAADEDDERVRVRRSAYAVGYARSRVRALMGDWEDEHEAIADSAALPDPDPALDRTDVLAAILAEIEVIAPERDTATMPK